MKKTRGILVLVVSMVACRKAYNPPVVAASDSYLVVEGVINSGSDSTIIKLSKTVNLSSKITLNPLLHAVLTVESDQNNTYPLTEAGNGAYVSGGLNLDGTRQYRLRIKTPGGKEYLSDFVPVKNAPPIDSIGFNIVTTPDTGLQIYVNTQDPNNNTNYYRWDYVENWQFFSKYVSTFISDGTKLVVRNNDQSVSVCYNSDVSSDIALASSKKLSRDVIYQDPIIFIKYSSEKIEAKYRVLVHEYALTPDAYTFWTNLKKNTEQLGTIFDAEPSQSQSNIHCLSNPAEPVVGYVSIGLVSTKTKFIYSSQLPLWAPAYPYQCNVDTAKVGKPDWVNLVLFPNTYLATDPIGSIFNPSAYLWTTRECADCTIRGSKIPPDFWK